MASLLLTFIVPVICSVQNGQPLCNLELTKVDSVSWLDKERGIMVTLINNQLTIIGE